ncbi:HD domain-containing protein [Oceanobacillus luteolus]|uniref:HD domain-containing protein n=1 Tax=Oceanobacillus luteolus TaxID=1274358 RepID=A0ABW4HNC9_9BACI|nr:HD domain-containing protein [Oceanobacillus luteolus]
MKEKAKRFAENAHKGHFRKAGNIPYITHPIRVANILESAGASEALICAAFLHDVVEDTPIEIEEIRAEFGKHVANLVQAHTEDKSKTWKERKQHTIDTLKTADLEVKQLIVADRLDNLLSLEKDLEEVGPKIWKIFNAGYKEQQWYNEAIVMNMDHGLSEVNRPQFFSEFEAAVKRVFK